MPRSEQRPRIPCHVFSARRLSAATRLLVVALHRKSIDGVWRAQRLKNQWQCKPSGSHCRMAHGAWRRLTADGMVCDPSRSYRGFSGASAASAASTGAFEFRAQALPKAGKSELGTMGSLTGDPMLVACFLGYEPCEVQILANGGGCLRPAFPLRRCRWIGARTFVLAR